MAALRKLGQFSRKLFVKNTPFKCTTRSYEEFKKMDMDYALRDLEEYVSLKPLLVGPYPRTEAERLKAAERYGMHPDEYKPFPEEMSDQGDYPDLPWISVEARDPFYPWDFPVTRRNFGEPVHFNDDMMGEDRYDYGVRKYIEDHHASAIFIACFIGIIVLGSYAPTVSQPMMDKQYPGQGEHYTFQIK
ncbi:NADH dehydrogenase [ubiquinone] 1 beta subcomplex subunit 8, mitochondrial [Habropoda laboriosa]|uniref:NADH dehydrogenase [ubiquinone] 1 beta subcomplex subunit 8, mitochondrial n=1 Tax=Habropoda laboriosa TaxID=597456 RepID=A0A0L7R3L8_9HYME|nr:PREDICTED: NADH dehydrogenase [ubiquinone] 1 beta subcomplex subunit 8, mitochondrial [Habropoda laboriosa]KOC65346.1 NADH dehydrogenase [ubiquinone] 1 beta subcomplex subunit 8, mitochondrial [Habropoda laboriosa]